MSPTTKRGGKLSPEKGTDMQDRRVGQAIWMN